MNPLEAYRCVLERTREVTLLASTMSILSWDEETKMPVRASGLRAEQMAQLARCCHELASDERLGEWLEIAERDPELTAEPTSVAGTNLRVIRREYDRLRRVPNDLIGALARVRSRGHRAWVEARQANDFNILAPILDEQINLARQKADALAVTDADEPWDALADEWEFGLRARDLEPLFQELRPCLVALLDELLSAPNPPTNPFLTMSLPRNQQEAFVREVIAAIGFDFERGRLDESEHPFCLGWHRDDVRITTRFESARLLLALGSTLHEAGHGLYDQHHPADHFGSPMGRAASTAMQEAQARLWENHIGRGHAFWRWCFPKLREHFGNAVAHLALDEVYAAANVVKPDYIRMEAGETTYNLHILIRFDLERALINGQLSVNDLPEAWHARYESDLGLPPLDHRKGVLQDIHWAEGLFGYFPTYTLGNLFAAQLMEQAEHDLDDLPELIARGEFHELIAWMNRHVFSQGMRFDAPELIERITGRPLSIRPLLRHLNGLRPIYGLPESPGSEA